MLLAVWEYTSEKLEGLEINPSMVSTNTKNGREEKHILQVKDALGTRRRE